MLTIYHASSSYPNPSPLLDLPNAPPPPLSHGDKIPRPPPPRILHNIPPLLLRQRTPSPKIIIPPSPSPRPSNLNTPPHPNRNLQSYHLQTLLHLPPPKNPKNRWAA
ncbi:uncharacterized protein MYCFIDRAFT_173807 [Pseudocercospora fijiensis CIRAD86]|uniref:Uncharacterized protein n=1 Tax=Pseudocercospora fijiensis (strain CIRAD86) TaxID=383855 RepID=M3B6B9_PSEFD|nr:uncharacterized protein MYCFIDRAFT_173807 [Pseudocercospora fijiensis CIRAD86]EME84912.1 hypothetical protein MYCFIDRAFT_173807 [Pseudocercospora fijiensis CIRAD86]